MGVKIEKRIAFIPNTFEPHLQTFVLFLVRKVPECTIAFSVSFNREYNEVTFRMIPQLTNAFSSLFCPRLSPNMSVGSLLYAVQNVCYWYLAIFF